MLDLNLCIEPTEVTFGWVVTNLEGRDEQWDFLVNTYGIHEGKIERISGSGFLSYVLRVIFAFNGSDETFSVILKVPTTIMVKAMHGSEDVGFDSHLINSHNQEILFYKEIAAKCSELYFPKMYGYVESDQYNSTHGRLLVEDVGDRGVLPDFLNGLNVNQSAEALKALARFHAFSILHVDEGLFSLLQYQSNPMDRPEDTSSLGVYGLDPYFLENQRAIMQILAVENGFDSHVKFGIQPILTHGDFWANNMFFEKSIDGTIGDKVLTIFDWQMMRPGTGMSDVARFLAVSTTEEVLAEHFNDLLKIYYQTLVETLNKSGAEAPYSFEKMMEMFRYEFPFEFYFASIIIPTLLKPVNDCKIRTNVINRLKFTFRYARDCLKI